MKNSFQTDQQSQQMWLLPCPGVCYDNSWLILSYMSSALCRKVYEISNLRNQDQWPICSHQAPEPTNLDSSTSNTLQFSQLDQPSHNIKKSNNSSSKKKKKPTILAKTSQGNYGHRQYQLAQIPSLRGFTQEEMYQKWENLVARRVLDWEEAEEENENREKEKKREAREGRAVRRRERLSGELNGLFL